MDHPGRGNPYSIRQLADAIGLSHHALVGHLLTGERGDCDSETAHRIAEALGVSVRVLFAQPASPETNEPDPERKQKTHGATEPPT